MKAPIALLIIICLSFVFVKTAFAKSGCCSWHDGVDYCDTSVGQSVCNDGTYSPTCTCYKSTPYTPPAPPTPVCEWHGSEYNTYEECDEAKRNSIKSFYYILLKRAPYNDDEVNNYVNSGKDYATIEKEFLNSDEYKKVHETPVPMVPTISPTPTTTYTPVEESGDDSWLYWAIPITGLAGLGYAGYKRKGR